MYTAYKKQYGSKMYRAVDLIKKHGIVINWFRGAISPSREQVMWKFFLKPLLAVGLAVLFTAIATGLYNETRADTGGVRPVDTGWNLVGVYPPTWVRHVMVDGRLASITAERRVSEHHYTVMLPCSSHDGRKIAYTWGGDASIGQAQMVCSGWPTAIPTAAWRRFIATVPQETPMPKALKKVVPKKPGVDADRQARTG